jgi:hypothetical protein
MLTSLEDYNYFANIHVITSFKKWPFFFLKIKNFVRTVDLYLSYSFHFITVFLWNVFLRKLCYLSEIGLPPSQTLPLQLLGFYLFLEYMRYLRSL